jgi:hypothetical protein
MNKSFSKKIVALSIILLFVSGCGNTDTVANIDKFGSNDIFYSVYYGTMGGNVQSISISIDNNGVVTGDSEILQKCINKNIKLTPEQLQSIVDRANNNNFFTLPDEVGSPVANPNYSSKFVFLTTSATAKRVVSLPNANNTQFDALFNYINQLATQDGCGM